MVCYHDHRGLQNRVAKATCLNTNSSRSHAIIKLFLDFEDDDIDDDNQPSRDGGDAHNSERRVGHLGALNQVECEAATPRSNRSNFSTQLNEPWTVTSTCLDDDALTTNYTVDTPAVKQSRSLGSGRSMRSADTRTQTETTNTLSTVSAASCQTPRMQLQRNRQRRLLGLGAAGDRSNVPNASSNYTFDDIKSDIGDDGVNEADSNVRRQRTGERIYSCEDVNAEAERIITLLGTSDKNTHRERLRFRRRVLTLVDLAG
jgi:hypothetical protein